MSKALFKYLLFAVSSCVACTSKSALRRLYQPVAALGFSLSCQEARAGWDTGTPLSTYVRGLERAWPWSAWGSWWALLLHSCLSGQNVRTPQEAIQLVRHFQGGQDCRCCVVKGMIFVYASLQVPFPISNRSICSLLYPCPQLDSAEQGSRWKSTCLSAQRWFECCQTISCQILLSLQPDNVLWHAVRYSFRELSLAIFPVLCH